MAESLGASQVKVNFKNRTGVTLGHQHDDGCETSARGGSKITNEESGKYERGTCTHYRSLHHHSTYSFLDGFALPDAHVRRATEVGMPAFALTEHGNVSSHVKLEQAAVAAGVKPIFGVELYVDPPGTDGKGSQLKNHLTVLAMDTNGYQNLLRLVTRTWEQHHYHPTARFEDLVEFNEGLIVLSGCTGSALATSLVGGRNVDPARASYKRAKLLARQYQRVFGDRYYLEMQAFPELDNVRAINMGLQRMSGELGIQTVATGDVHYTALSENEMQQILHNVRGGGRTTLEEQARAWGYNVPLSPPTSDLYMYRRMRATGLSHLEAWRAIYNTEEIAGRCNVTLPKMPMVQFPVPDGYADSHAVWEAWLREGWHRRGIASKPDVHRYAAALRHERKTIEDKNFIDYFLIVSDVVKFAKRHGIPVGPARGSAAASLICYLLEITEVNPMAFPNLLFERFIDATRKDLPDIDLDFDDRRRHEIRDYLVAKYGEAQVGNVCSFTTYKSKLALDDVARVYKIPKWEVEQVKELLVERSSGDLRASATIEDTVAMFDAAAGVFERYPDLAHAVQLEGQVKGLGIHAAGLVVGRQALTQACASYVKTVNGEERRVLSVDKHDAEYLNILKIDVLGLTTLGMIAECLRLINKPLSWLYEIPLDDEATIRGFQNNDVVGIFQFDGRAMRGVTAELKPDNFLEIADLTALARPGPLHNGAASEYIDIKRGRKQIRSYHPLIDDIVKFTHGQIVYQEQILRIMGEIGGFDHVHRATVRKIISKKLGEQEFNRWWNDFLVGALERGVPESDARDIWNACITAGSYAFNVAHAISYGMLAWWTMYLKQHHPLEFYAASLGSYGEDKQLELLRDVLRHNLTILPPDFDDCEINWTSVPAKRAVMGGLTQVKGIGPSIAEKIIEARDEGTVKCWEDITSLRGIGESKLKMVQDFIASDDPYGVYRLERMLAETSKLIRKSGRLPNPTHKSIEIPYAKGESIEVVWVGVITTRNLKELFELHFSRTGEELNPEGVRDPDLNEWVTMWGDDGTDTLYLTVSRWKYPKLREAIWSINLDTDVVLVRGYKSGNQARRAIYVNEIWVFSED